MLREFDEQDTERPECRFCTVEDKMDEVLSTFQGIQWRDNDGEYEGIAAKAFSMEHQLRFVISESYTQTDAFRRSCVWSLREYSSEFDRQILRFVDEVLIENWKGAGGSREYYEGPTGFCVSFE